jgi:hypothetical protein
MGTIRGFLFLAAGVFAAGGLLTLLRSPDWLNWKLALVAGEFGHWLALVALALGSAAWALRAGHAGLAWSTVVLSVGAAVLLLKPTWEAARIGRTLPQRLEAAFGGAASPRAAFSVGGWFESAPAPVAVETREFAPGLKLDLYRATGRGTPGAAPVWGFSKSFSNICTTSLAHVRSCGHCIVSATALANLIDRNGPAYFHPGVFCVGRECFSCHEGSSSDDHSGGLFHGFH